MKLTALRLHNVRRFAGRGVAIENIGDGVNVLCEANEFGKSTCFDALHALFFQRHSGTPGAIQALRPYSGGNPLIEVDIVTSDGHFRLRKQFYGSKQAQVTNLGTGRLLAQADEAEAYIEGLVGNTSGPAGLLWVRQGNTGINHRVKADEDGEKRARETVLTSVQGEVEAVTGGRRMSAIIEACESELSNLVTATYRPKVGGPYEQAKTAHEDLTRHAQALEIEVRGLHEALDKRRSIKARLSELDQPEEDTVRRNAVEEAERHVAEARLQDQQRKTLEAEANLTRSQYEQARDAYDVYRNALISYTAVQAALVQSTQTRDEALIHRQEVQGSYDAATAEVETTEATEKEMRELLERLDRAMRARDAAERLARARENLTDAEMLRQEIEVTEATIRTLSLPDDQITALENLEHEIAGLRAAEAARATTLRMAYDAGVTPSITLNEALLVDQSDTPLSGLSQLSLPGLGVLTVRPALAANESGLEAKLADHRRQLEVLGVDSLSAARQRQAQVRTLSGEVELSRQRFGFIAPEGLEKLREEIATLEADSSGDLELKGDPVEVRDALTDAGQKVTEARHRVTEVRPVREQADRTIIEAEKHLSVLNAQIEGLNGVLGEVADRDMRAQTLAEAAQTADADARIATESLEALNVRKLDLENAEATLRRAKSVISAIEDEKAGLRQDQSELNGRISAQSRQAVEEDLAEAQDQARATEATVKRFEHEIALLKRLKEALNAARSDAREHYFAPVLGELRPLLGLLFDDATVTFDDETLLPRAICRNGLEEQVPVLSGGMREQLAVLTRLAFARLLAREGRPAPVILDDALVYSDDDRIEKMFDALHRQARDQQIIVFSCRQRAFSLLGGNKLKLTEWAPTSGPI